MDDDAIIEALVAVRGVGRWTAEMFLMFHELRPDVLPVDDLGLRKGVSVHYRDGAAMSADEVRAFGERWRPWRSAATWYLWRSLDPDPDRVLTGPQATRHGRALDAWLGESLSAPKANGTPCGDRRTERIRAHAAIRIGPPAAGSRSAG